MGKESIHKHIKRKDDQRVILQYVVHEDGAIEHKELPFVLGFMGDWSVHPESPLQPLKDRKFVTIDRDNFNDVLKAMGTRLSIKVPDRICGIPDTLLPVELRIEEYPDLRPESIVNQIAPTRKLLETREQLSALLSQADGNDKFIDILTQVVENSEMREALRNELDTAMKDTGIMEDSPDKQKKDPKDKSKA